MTCAFAFHLPFLVHLLMIITMLKGKLLHKKIHGFQMHVDELLNVQVSFQGRDWETVALHLSPISPTQQGQQPGMMGIVVQLLRSWLKVLKRVEAKNSFSARYHLLPSPEEK